MNRQEYNRKILKYLWDNKEFNEIMDDNISNYEDMIGCYQAMKNSVELYPQQRFGQLFCNYWGGDYRSENPSKLTKDLQNYLFPDNSDPFFEESKYTYYRLTKEIPEQYKKELEEKKGKKVYYASGDNTKVGTLESLFLDPIGSWHWVIDGNKVSTSKSITLL